MASTSPTLGLPSHRVWQLAKIPPSTLNYWVQIRLVRPSLRTPQGKRVEQWWSIRDVLVVRTVRALRESGASLQQVRKAKLWLEQFGDDLANVRLYWDGNDIVVTDQHGQLLSALRRPGQQMFQLVSLPLAHWDHEARTDDEAREVDLADFRRKARKRRDRQAELYTLPSQTICSPPVAQSDGR